MLESLEDVRVGLGNRVSNPPSPRRCLTVGLVCVHLTCVLCCAQSLLSLKMGLKDGQTQHLRFAVRQCSSGVETGGRQTVCLFQEMGAEFFHNGGEIEGEFRMDNPHMDSPLMMTPMTDKNFAVIRMKYQGPHPTAKGSFYFRSGNVLPPASYAKVGVWLLSGLVSVPWEILRGSMECFKQGEAVWNLTDPSQWEVQFDVVPDGQYHVYYVALFPFNLTSPELQLNLTQMRLNPVWGASNGQAVKIDWIRVVRGIPVTDECSSLVFGLS
jgi:hypothetical protein